uniref:Uncharacterized protein n=1 Tax=Acrobeloides nanus TaxID=290746 RepID=A0A914CRF2_9BILA
MGVEHDDMLQEALTTARAVSKKMNLLIRTVDSLKTVASTVTQEEDGWYGCGMSNGETRGNNRPNGETRGNGRPDGETRGIFYSGNDFQQNQHCHNGCGDEEITEVNENGNEYYEDRNGHENYDNEDGNEYYVDEDGNEYYEDGNEHEYYDDGDGNEYYVDEDGNEYYVDDDGNEYYYDGNEYEEEVPGPSYL